MISQTYMRDERLRQQFSRVHTILSRQIERDPPSSADIQDGGDEVQEPVAGGDQRVGHDTSSPKRPDIDRIRNGQPQTLRHLLHLIIAICQECGPFEMIDANTGVALSAAMTFSSTTVDLLAGIVDRVRVPNDQRAAPVSHGECHDDRRHSAVDWLGRRCHPPALGYDFQHIPDGCEMVTFRQSREERVSDGIEDRMICDFEGGGQR